MKLNVDAELRAFNGEPMTQTNAEDSPKATLKSVLLQACLSADPSEYRTGEQKYRVYQLLQRIDKGGEIEVTAEEIAELKKLVGACYPVAVVGPAWTALEAA